MYHFFLVCLTVETFRSMMITSSDSRMILLVLLSGSDCCEMVCLPKIKLKNSDVSESKSVSILGQKKVGGNSLRFIKYNHSLCMDIH